MRLLIERSSSRVIGKLLLPVFFIPCLDLVQVFEGMCISQRAQTITTSYGRNPAAAVGVPKQLRELLG
jgi:hypothetical protein